MKNKNTFFRIAGIVGLILLLGLVFLARQAAQPAPEATMHDHSDPAQHEHQMSTAMHMDPNTSPSGHLQNDVRVVDYDAYRYHFNPDPLVVYAGEKVRLMVKSRDVAHGALIPDADFSTEILPGDRKSAEFTAPAQPGTYDVFCNVFCGPDHGNMSGKLVVLPAAK